MAYINSPKDHPFSNSPLVDCVVLSPNKNDNRYDHGGHYNNIDTITIHCVVGQLSAESIGNLFVKPERGASSNYGVGYDGRIGMYVEEKDRSWCSSSRSNDFRAVTIEVACDKTHPYAVNEKAYAALVKLVADICQRNNIKKLLWKGDKSLIGKIEEQNMTVHRWFENTACPGDYLYNKMGQIAYDVNVAMGVIVETPKEEGRPMVQNGSKGEHVKFLQKQLQIAGYSIDADGDFGPKTKAAVVDFQKKNGLDADGIVGPKTWKVVEAIKAAPKVETPKVETSKVESTKGYPMVQYGNKNDYVKKVQTYLVVIGKKYGISTYAIDVDGHFGRNTLNAVKLFQKNNGLDADGIVGENTWRVLAKVAAEATAATAPATTEFKPYMVRVKSDALNVRKGPGTNYGVHTVIRDHGSYTIVEQKGNWGKLKSGAGWINLDYTTKI